MIWVYFVFHLLHVRQQAGWKSVEKVNKHKHVCLLETERRLQATFFLLLIKMLKKIPLEIRFLEDVNPIVDSSVPRLIDEWRV